MEPQGGQEV